MVIKVKDLSKKYDNENIVLNDLTFHVQDNEFHGLVGRNGAGKSTLINILTGQSTRYNGSVEVLGYSPKSDAVNIKSNVGILPEKESPPPYLTPRETLHLFGRQKNVDEKTIKSRMKRLSNILEYEGKLDTQNKSLSRGNKQKVMISIALINHPDLVFIDEPLVNLDLYIQSKLKNFLKEYHNGGRTILLSTHYIESALDLCDKISVLKNGKIKTTLSNENINSSEKIKNILR